MSKVKDLEGQQFGEWTVVKRSGYLHTKLGNKTSLSLWLCRCSCGNTAKVPVCNLTTGKSTQCRKCADFKVSMKNRDGDIWDSAFRFKVVNRSKQKNIDVEIDATTYKSIVSQDCYYCGSEPETEYSYTYSKKTEKEVIKVNGIDRVNNQIGYTSTNCVSCCFTCNFMKNTLDYETFINHVNKIASHQKKKKND